MSFSRLMKGTPEEKVIAYLENFDHKPLVFSECEYSHYERLPNSHLGDPGETFPVKGSVQSKIVWAVRMSLNRGSMYIDRPGRTQCNGSRRRSALDLWRHIRYYDQSIDLFQIMRELYKIKLNKSYCSVVRKRVFFTFQYTSILETAGSVSCSNVRDEFGLYLDDWRDIGLHGE